MTAPTLHERAVVVDGLVESPDLGTSVRVLPAMGGDRPLDSAPLIKRFGTATLGDCSQMVTWFERAAEQRPIACP